MADIPDDPNRGVKANTIAVTGNDLHAIFEPVFKEIDRLVAEQINKVRIKRLQDKHPKGADIKAGIFLTVRQAIFLTLTGYFSRGRFRFKFVPSRFDCKGTPRYSGYST